MYYDSESAENSSASASDYDDELNYEDGNREYNSDNNDAQSNVSYGENLRDDLEAAFKGDFEFGGGFAVSKTFSLAAQPGLHIEGIGTIGLPLSEREAKLIEAAAIQAPFGKGAETVVDTAVRDTFEINPDKFSFKNPAWTEFLQQVTKTVAEGLGFPPTRPLPRAELYKMLLYKTGSHFLPHKDTEKAEGMFASLIIVLPSKFEGGEVHVSHGDSKDVFDVSSTSEFSISALAWYTDVIHEVKPVTSGYRLAISYNLVNGSRGLPAPHLPDMHSAVSGIQQIFRMWANGDYDRKHSSGTIAYILDHQYSEAGLQFTALKGKDAALVSNIRRVAEKEGVSLRLGALVYEVSGDAGSDHPYGRGIPQMDMINDTEYRIEGLYDLEGDLAKLKHPIRLSEKLDLIPKDPFKEEKPDDEEFEGYTGNEGAPMTHWYRRAALVMYLAGAGDGPEAPMDVPYAFRKLRRWMPEGPTEKNRKMVEFVLNKGYLGIRLGVLPETTLLLIDLAVEWNDFAMWEAVLQTSGGGRSPHLLSSASLLRAWNVFPFSATQPIFDKLVLCQPSTKAAVEFIHLLRSSLPHDQQDAASWCAQRMAATLSSIKKPSVDDVNVFVKIAKTEGLTFFSDTILEQVIQFPHMFNFWIALGQKLWEKKDSLLPSGGTPEERSNATAVLNHILDRLLVTAIPEYDYGVNYRPNVLYISCGLPQDRSRIFKLLDLMTLTRRVDHSIQLITLVSRPHEHLPVKYKELVVPLIPGLRAHILQHHTTDLPILDAFLRALVGRYLQDLLGSPSRQPEAAANKADCECEDCAQLDRFLRSDAVTETFQVGQRRRSHIEDQLRSTLQGVLTSNPIGRGTRGGLQLTKTRETLAAGGWDARVQKAYGFLAVVGTQDELVRIMGERYPDVQAALAGTRPYEMGTLSLTVPQPGVPTADATTSGNQAGSVVAGVKRKAEDEEDTIDLTSE